MKRTVFVLAAAALTLAACQKKEENTEINTPAAEQPAPAPAPAAAPIDSTGAASTTGATTTTGM